MAAAVLCLGENGVLTYGGATIDPTFDSFDIAQPRRRRIITSSLIAAFGHIHTEARTPALGIGSAVVGWRPLSYLWVRTGSHNIYDGGGAKSDPTFDSFDIAQPRRRRIITPSLIAAFGHIHNPYRGENTSSGHRECGGGVAAAGVPQYIW